MTQPSALLTCFALEVALDVPAPLPRPWHEALAAWPAWDVRREWAARPHATADLLAAAAGDRHAKVRSAAVGNPVLPLQAALAGAGTCVPYGPLAVATRGDCPDALAARLIAYVGRLGRRRRESWKQ